MEFFNLTEKRPNNYFPFYTTFNFAIKTYYTILSLRNAERYINPIYI